MALDHFESTNTLPQDAVKHMEAALAWCEEHPEDAPARTKARELAKALADIKTPALPLELLSWKGTDIPERKWLVQDWLPAGQVALFTGDGGVGKSRLMLQVAAGVASGGGEDNTWIEAVDDFGALRLGSATRDEDGNPGVPVVFATWEDEPTEVWRRLSQISGDAAPWVTPDRLANFHVAPMALHGPIWAPVDAGSRHMTTVAEVTHAGRELRRRCEEVADKVGARLLIVDPLAAAYLSDENSRALVRAFMTDLSVWADAASCAVVIVAHPPKSDFETSGSTDWKAASRAVWNLKKETIERKTEGNKKNKTDMWKLACTKSNYGPSPQDVMLQWDTDPEALRWKVRGAWNKHKGRLQNTEAGKGGKDGTEDDDANGDFEGDYDARQ